MPIAIFSSSTPILKPQIWNPRFFSAELFLILISSLISRSVSGSVQTVNATATAIVSAESTVHPLVFNCSVVRNKLP
uniref:Uncharacterized protein n=1 Tax=Gossypium raimondii TaxID=29730 RepID=A0A0D2RR87_GOSRA|nr:hypothetical protein B456_005G218100 [Gossypium raimondii]KJB32001.1 hypothetical protein B456_005G218100 [Gossypium raimondii]